MIKNNTHPYLIYLQEIKRRIIYTLLYFGVVFAISIVFAGDIYNFFALPLINVLKQNNLPLDFLSLKVSDIFITYIRLAFFVALIVSFPFFSLQILLFSFPALYKMEKALLFLFIILLNGLFLFGVFFAYKLIISNALNFFLIFIKSFNSAGELKVNFMPSVEYYFNFFKSIIIAFGFMFEFPIIIISLLFFDIITTSHLKNFRRYFIALSFILAAVLTPPDPYSQIIMASCLIFFYEIVLLCANMLGKIKRK